MIHLLTVVCGVGCIALVVAEWRGLRTTRVVTKLVASAAFVAIGGVALAASAGLDQITFARTIVVGLALGAVGDAALLGRGSRWFLAGLVAFLAGHLAYVIAAGGVTPPAQWLALAGGYAALPVIVGGVALVGLWSRLGTLRLPVIGYVLTIIVMVIAAIALARGDHTLTSTQRARFVTGAVLFFASDLAVARDRFVIRAFANKAWGLPAYYAGQLLIAWSLVGS